jgi:DNA-binding transcriptional ArsR family regulator
MKIVEKRFRGSVICRVLGYPISYAIVKMLSESGEMGFKDLLKNVKRSKSTVCFHMTKLRMANIVRYEKKGTETMYWIKYPRETKALLDACESMVKRIVQRIEKDF